MAQQYKLQPEIEIDCPHDSPPETDTGGYYCPDCGVRYKQIPWEKYVRTILGKK